MSVPFTFDTTIERDGWEHELEVTYSVSRYVPAVLYGDHPQPAEGGEVEVLSVREDGRLFELTDAEEAAILAECEERSGEDMAEDAAAAAEYRADQRRDDEMMARWEARGKVASVNAANRHARGAQS